MIENIDSKKVSLIKEITAIDSEQELFDIEKYVKKMKWSNEYQNIFKATRKSISVEELKREQNYSDFDRVGFDALVDELAIEESIDELLLMLN